MTWELEDEETKGRGGGEEASGASRIPLPSSREQGWRLASPLEAPWPQSVLAASAVVPWSLASAPPEVHHSAVGLPCKAAMRTEVYPHWLSDTVVEALQLQLTGAADLPRRTSAQAVALS